MLISFDGQGKEGNPDRGARGDATGPVNGRLRLRQT